MQNNSETIRCLRIEAYSRLHLTLISMMHCGYRVNGGAGFYINHPSVTVEAKHSDVFDICDQRQFPMSQHEQDRLSNILFNCIKNNSMCNNIRIIISGSMLTHFGFGSGTTIRLACLESLYLLNNRKYDRSILIKESKRGGTSGVGINTYFDGGLVVDLGRKSNLANTLLSSSENESDKIPTALLMQQFQMPSWEVGICIPHEIKNLTEKEEANFFKSVCPIPLCEAQATAYDVFMGVVPAVIEGDQSSFINAIKNIQQGYWKRNERNIYGECLRKFEQILYNNGALAVGMSSLGPSLYFLSGDVSQLIKTVEPYMKQCTLFCTTTRNAGRDVIYG